MPARFRNISGDERIVKYGVIGPQRVAVDGIVTVRDDVVPNYDHQVTIWRREFGAAATAAPAAAASLTKRPGPKNVHLGPASSIPAGAGPAATPKEA